MSDHLSHDEFAKCFVDGPAARESRHLRDCPECSAELEHFGGAISSFRTAVRDRVDAQVDSEVSAVSQDSVRPAAVRTPERWALAVAAIAGLVLVPVVMLERSPQEVIGKASVETDADALMGAINLHLLRTVPAPMEPMLKLVPSADVKNQSGGVQ
jgi:anti-sigma factor RsiW